MCTFTCPRIRTTIGYARVSATRENTQDNDRESNRMAFSQKSGARYRRKKESRARIEGDVQALRRSKVQARAKVFALLEAAQAEEEEMVRPHMDQCLLCIEDDVVIN